MKRKSKKSKSKKRKHNKRRHSVKRNKRRAARRSKKRGKKRGRRRGYIGSALHKFNLARRAKSGRRSRRRAKRASSPRRRHSGGSSSGSAILGRIRYNMALKKLTDKGYTLADAHKVLARANRIANARRVGDATRAKSAQAAGNFFAGIADAAAMQAMVDRARKG